MQILHHGRNAIQIYGKDLGDIKGKTTQRKSDHIPGVVLLSQNQ